MNRTPHFPSIEPLESRIAPAALNGNVLTYKDVDGDKVKVTFSGGSGTLTAANFTFDDPTAFTNNANVQLQKIDLLADTAFNGVSIKFAVTKAGGDGRANVGFIEGSSVDLATVSVNGDLGRINAGDSSTSTTALGTLKVRSMGVLGLTTQTPGVGNLESDINGPVGKLMVAKDLKEEFFTSLPSNAADGKIGLIKIGGSLFGGPMTGDGSIFVSGDIDNVTIKHDVVGGAGVGAGKISTTSGKIGNITIGGSLMAGPTGDGGSISSVTGLGAIKIGHDVMGVNGNSGFIRTNGAITSLTIGGSLLGGVGSDSGAVIADQSIGPVKIKHDLRGGDGLNSGLLESSADIGAVKINGSVVGGGTGSHSGISAGGSLGAVKIKHDLTGSSGGVITISAVGATSVPAGTTTNLGIAKVTVGGDVNEAHILAGFDLNGFGVNGGVQIGAVKVGGDWTASSISAGVFNQGSDHTPGGTGDNLNFGDADDVHITAGATGITASIASIKIKGDVVGTAASGDHFGFVAQQIGSFKAAGTVVPLTPNTDLPVDFSSATSSDVTLHEV